MSPVKFYHTIGDTREFVFRAKQDGVPYSLAGGSVSVKLYLARFDEDWANAVLNGVDMTPDANQIVNTGVARFDWTLADALPAFTPEVYKGRVVTNVDGEVLTFPTDDYGDEYFVVVVNEQMPTGAVTDLLPDPTIIRRVYDDMDKRVFANHPNFNFLGASGASWTGGSVGFGGVESYRRHIHEEAWGVAVPSLGTSVSGRADIVHQNSSFHDLCVGLGSAYLFGTRISIKDLPTPTNRYVFFAGFFDGDTVDPEYNRGILFKYRDDENGGKIQALCRSAAGVGNETVVDTGIAPLADTWYILRIEVEPDASEARFYIDGIRVATINSNIASGHGNHYTVEINNDRITTDGVTNITPARVDYYLLEQRRTDSRF